MCDVIATLARAHPEDFLLFTLLLSIVIMVCIITICSTARGLYEDRCRHVECLARTANEHHLKAMARISDVEGPGPVKPPASPGWEDKEDG